MGSEKRKTKRVDLMLKVDCQYEGNFLFENATNISEHGIFIETREPKLPGTMINLRFQLPEGEKRIDVLGEVIWVNPYRPGSGKDYNPGMGIRFVNLNEIDKDKILTLVKRIAVL
jgi:type IV pilus assembly protein PilZ